MIENGALRQQSGSQPQQQQQSGSQGKGQGVKRQPRARGGGLDVIQFCKAVAKDEASKGVIHCVCISYVSHAPY